MKKITFLIFIILVSLNIISLYKYKLSKETNSEIKSFYKKQIEKKEKQLLDIEGLYQNRILISKETENIRIKENIKLVNLSGDTVSPKKIFKEKSLVFRYSILNCGDCVDSEFKVLKEYAKNYRNNIIIIGESTKKWTIPIRNWGIILNQFLAIFENRIKL